MKSLISLLFFFLCFSSAATAQSCILQNDADFCTSCANLITEATGVVSGIVTVPSNSGTETIPATCDFGYGPAPLILGALTLDIRTNSNLIIDSGVGVQSGVTAVTLTGNGNAVMSVAGVVFGNQVSANPNFGDLQNLISDCMANPGCSTVGGAVTALPVTLVAWSAKADKGNVLLDWSSAAESDNDFYLLEHGTDGVNFTEIARISGRTQGRNGIEQHYHFEHSQPGSGLHYYRLSQQDLDGTHTMLGFRSIELFSGGAMKVYPNPVAPGAVVRLAKSADDPSEVAQLFSLLGKEIASFTLDEEYQTSALTLPGNLRPGLYLLRTQRGTTRLLVR